MAVKATAPKPTPANLVNTEARGLRLVKPLMAATLELSVETDEEYTAADELLGQVRRKRKEWSELIETVLAPLRQAKLAADELNRRIDRPLATMETDIKGLMAAYDRAKLEAKRQLEEAARQEQERTRKALEEAAAKVAGAKTPAMRARLEQKQTALETQLTEQTQQAEELIQEASPVQSLNSQRKTVKSWRLTGSIEDVCRAVLEGKIPPQALDLNRPYILGVFRLDMGASVAKWPGFEVYEDIQIAGRG